MERLKKLCNWSSAKCNEGGKVKQLGRNSVILGESLRTSSLPGAPSSCLRSCRADVR